MCSYNNTSRTASGGVDLLDSNVVAINYIDNMSIYFTFIKKHSDIIGNLCTNNSKTFSNISLPRAFLAINFHLT